MKRVASAVVRNVGFICVALVLVYCVIGAFDPPRLNWGDSGSDFNVMSSGRNFQNYGFVQLRFTAFLFDPKLLVMPEDKVFMYTHYPQLPDLVNGVLRKVFGLSDIVQFRFVALALSFAALFFIYRLMERYWGRRAAQIGLALWVANPLWIQHADYLHHAPYAAFFGFGSVYFLARYLDENRRRLLLTSGLFLFVTYLASYDYWIFAPMLLAMVTAHHYRGLFRAPVIRTLAVLGAFAAVALASKFGTNIWAHDGLRGFLNDLHFQLMERATDKVARSTFAGGVWQTVYGRTERFFTLLSFAVTAYWIALPFARKRWGSRFPLFADTSPNPLALLVAGLPFLLLFREIWVGQYYPSLLLLPFFAVASAALISHLWDSGQRLVAIALAAALLLNSAVENARFKKAFLRRETIRTLAAQLDSVSVPGQKVLVNHVFDAQYRYYFQRHTIAVILNPPGNVELALAAHADPVTHPRSGRADGAIFVQHKHLTDELYDKGYYYILGRYGLWKMWGNPPRYRDGIDDLIVERDSTLMAKVAQMGQKLYDAPDYAIWRIRPPTPAPTTSR